MDDSPRKRWLNPAIFVGVIYLAVGLASGALAAIRRGKAKVIGMKLAGYNAPDSVLVFRCAV